MKIQYKKDKLNHAIYFGIACLTVVISFTVLVFANGETQYLMTKEDGFFESVGAIGWFIASIFFFNTFWKDKRGNNLVFLRTKRNMFFCLLAIFCFIACGEEISWGQRIFKLQTPELLMKINRQGETNLHNITFIQDRFIDGGDLPFWVKMLSMTKVFQAFWFGYCVLLPTMSKFGRRAYYYLEKVNVPLIPIGLSSVFLANYLISRFLPLVYNTGYYSNDHYFVEVKECNFGLLFMLVSLYFLQSTINSGTVYKHTIYNLYQFSGRLNLAKAQLSEGITAGTVLHKNQGTQSFSKTKHG